MNMTRIVIGTALGVFLAQGILLAVRQLLASRPADGMRAHIGRVIPAAWIGGFTKYSALAGASAAVIVLGVWAVGDYLAARSAQTVAAANTFDSSAPAVAADVHNATDDAADAAALAAKDDPSGDSEAHKLNPYADADFKVRRRGGASSLKDKLLQKAEAKAGNELLRDMRQHASRSQYDCETAEHAAKYLKAGLDVWGFASWQSKYYPMESYKGATSERCKDIHDVIEPTALDLKTAVAQGSHR